VRSARLEYQITGCALPLNDEANKRWSALGVPGAASSGRAWAAGLLMQLETNVCCWQIVLQKSQNAVRLISR
jgi:hypothetical protein